MKLNYKKSGSGDPLIILHGLFGSLDNWQSLSKKFTEDYTVYLVDQRNHGKSPHDDVFSYKAMADDLKELITDQDLTGVNLIGHSMGGKTVMQYAMEYAEDINKMIVVDIGPKFYPVHHQTILEALRSVDLESLENRSDAEDALKKQIDNVGIRQFLLKNLKREGDSYAWKMNLDVIEEKIENVGEEISGQSEVDTLFIRGENSDYIDPDEMDDIRKVFTRANLVSLKDAGHWIHAEQPEAFYHTVTRYLKNA